MTKQELMGYLQNYLNAEKECEMACDNLEKIKDRIKYLKGEPPKAITKDNDDGCLTFIVFVFIALVISLLIDYIGISFSVSFIFMIIFYFVIIMPTSYNIQNKKQQKVIEEEQTKLNQKHLATREKELPILEKQLNQALARFNLAERNLRTVKNQGVLPEYYQYREDVSDILRYLERGRADSLKEALNLLEADAQARSIAEENRRHNEEMERLQDERNQIAADAAREAGRAADAAQETADTVRYESFWNELNRATRKK